MSEEQWRNDGPGIYARKAPDESLFDDDMALIGPVGVVSYLNRQEATIAQQQARIEALEAALERIAKHPGGTAKHNTGIDWCRNEARAALAAHKEGTP